MLLMVHKLVELRGVTPGHEASVNQIREEASVDTVANCCMLNQRSRLQNTCVPLGPMQCVLRPDIKSS